MRPDGRFDEISVIRNLNKPGYHAGNGCFSADGKRFFFTRCTDGVKGGLKCAVFEAEVKKDGSFHKVRKLNDRINKRKYSSSQPYFATLQVNGQEQDVLFFVSDRRGGFGKDDIWYSLYSRKRKRFSAPLNCGMQVNSPGNDESPLLHSSGSRFYFSSDGHPGFGGKDIYTATANGVILSNRELMAQPINSQADDHNFSLGPDGKSGYLASNRKGANLLDQKYCCADIFRFQTPVVMKKQVEERLLALNDSSKAIAQAIILPPVQPDPDVRKAEDIDAQEIRNAGVKTTTKIGSGKVPEAKDNRVSYKVFFAKNSAQLSPSSIKSLNRIVEEIRTQKPKSVLISGFADYKGNLEYNRKLAISRAKTIQRYCAQKKLPVPVKMQNGDLTKALKTEDSDMLSMDRFVEISWMPR